MNSKTSRFSRLVTVVWVVLAITLCGGVTMAAGATEDDAEIGIMARTTVSGRALQELRVLTHSDILHITDDTQIFASSVRIPTGTRQFLRLRYSAESSCHGAEGSCLIDLNLFGSTAHPAGLVVFDHTDTGAPTAKTFEARSVEGFSPCLSQGLYTAVVVAEALPAVVGSATEFWLDESIFVIERVGFC
jgi:hypothetical protein